MLPHFTPGDFALASRLYFSLKAQDIIIAKHPKYGDIVKRISKINHAGNVWLQGDNDEESISPEQIGWVENKNIRAKVIYTIRQ